MIIKRGFIGLIYTTRSWIVHNDCLEARELEEPVAVQSKRWKPLNKKNQQCYPSPRPRLLELPGKLLDHVVDFTTFVDWVCRAAEELATLIWNGNVVTGLDALSKFFEMLPSSEFQVNMLDCQATQPQTTVLVTSGTVKFDGIKQRYFNQNFLLTAQSTPSSTMWKIVSDCFRFQDWARN
uniref:NTF2 domain-containing protein n=1 Tax=Sciurus vulgaris TaxID=55149 RepID=A0A8D2ASJ2_SCIVU